MNAEFLYLFVSTVVFLAGFVGVIMKWLITPLHKLDKTMMTLNFNIEKLTEQNSNQDEKIDSLKEITHNNTTRITILEQKIEK